MIVTCSTPGPILLNEACFTQVRSMPARKPCHNTQLKSFKKRGVCCSIPAHTKRGRASMLPEALVRVATDPNIPPTIHNARDDIHCMLTVSTTLWQSTRQRSSCGHSDSSSSRSCLWIQTAATMKTPAMRRSWIWLGGEGLGDGPPCATWRDMPRGTCVFVVWKDTAA